MYAINITEFGGPDVLRLAERDIPQPAAGEILIRVHAAGINRADVVQRMGFYPPPPGAPDIPGLEVAGEVAAVGAGVANWVEGDRVCALLAGGGYAEYAVASAAETLPVPEGVSMVEAAGLPEAVLTVWSNVMQRAALQPGESLLVHGGSSGIGTTAIQLAVCHGSTVFATAGSDEKTAMCERLGASRAVNYREEDFVEVLRAATDGAGVDVILDMVGGDYVGRNIQLAAGEGRIVNIAFLQGARTEVDLLPVMLKRLVLTGSTLRAREPEFKAALTAAVRERAWPWIESGEVKAIVHRVFAPEDCAEAHRVMEASTHIGKLILQWSGA